MSSQSQRINKGIAGLVRRLLGDIPGEDPAVTEERENNAVEFVREVLEKYNVLLACILAQSNTSALAVHEVPRLSQT